MAGSVDTKKLAEAVRTSYRQLSDFRDMRNAFIRQFTGQNYVRRLDSAPSPVNIIELAVKIYLRSLIASDPRCVIQTDIREHKRTAALFTMGMNHLLPKIGLRRTLMRAALNAMFGLGVVKKGIAVAGEVHIGGEAFQVGQPYAESVDFGDFVFDINATSLEKATYIGDICRLPLKDVRENERFKKSVRTKVAATSRHRTSQNDDKTPGSISGFSNNEDAEYEEFTEICTVFLPCKQRIVILPWGDDNSALTEALLDEEWDGPPAGPYSVLGFGEVPGNAMPLSPVSAIYDIHRLMNEIMSKLGDQAERQKTVVMYRPTEQDDAKRVKNCKDGDVIPSQDPQATQEVSFGGPHQTSMAFLVWLNDLANRFGGNLDLLGGLSPMADTATQDQILTREASKRLMAMQDEVVLFTKEIITDIAWYVWDDPLIDLRFMRRIPGTMPPVEVRSTFTAADRTGEFFDYNFDVEPYSLQQLSPAQRLSQIERLMTQFIIPMYPSLQQQGISVNFVKFLEMYKKYGQMIDIDEILEMGPQQQQGDPQQQAHRPPETTRRYEYSTRPGATRSGKEEALMGMLLSGGKGAQPDMAASLSRPTG